MIKVLFVCLGNICRSPLAEAVFNKLLRERGLEEKFYTDSAGTSRYHIGADPDPRTIECATNNAVPIQHKARQISSKDFSVFDYVLAMDQNNYREIEAIFGKNHPNFFLMREFDPDYYRHDVPDPYFGGLEGFQDVYLMLLRSCNNLLDHIIETRPDVQ